MSAPSPPSSPTTYLVDEQPHRLLNAGPSDQHVSAYCNLWQLLGDGGAPKSGQALESKGKGDRAEGNSYER